MFGLRQSVIKIVSYVDRIVCLALISLHFQSEHNYQLIEVDLLIEALQIDQIRAPL